MKSKIAIERERDEVVVWRGVSDLLIGFAALTPQTTLSFHSFLMAYARHQANKKELTEGKDLIHLSQKPILFRSIRFFIRWKKIIDPWRLHDAFLS